MDDDVEESILYELLVLSEWSQEQDIINKGVEKLSWTSYFSKVTNLLRNSPGSYYISTWVNQQLPWLFAVGASGKAVAILQDNALEIRTSRDNYSVPIGKTLVSKDPYPQWRKMEWSPDGTLLAIAHSNGAIDVYDLLALHLFLIPQVHGFSLNPSCTSNSASNNIPVNAVAGLVFIDSRTKNTHWAYELLCLDHFGELRAYFVSPTQTFVPSHTFSFASFVPYGATSFCVDQSRNLLVLATPTNTLSEFNSSGNNQKASGDCFGLMSWRIVDERPFYSKTPNDTNLICRRWFQSLKTKNYGNTVVKLSLSKDSSCLAAIHLSGAVSVWSIPSLKCQHYWSLDRQPGFDELSPSLLKLPALRRSCSSTFQNPFKFHPIDLNWWSDNSIILARCSGAVSVCDVGDLRNKLGSAAEFFEGSPRVSPAFDGTFLGLECETKVQRKRLQRPADNHGPPSAYTEDEILDDGSEHSEDEEKKITDKVVHSLLYWITDSERFRPPRKRPKLLARTYRLLGFKKTTPEELYIWKLDAEEYGEALALARAYGLDCDLVYQRQWKNAPATVAAINDYLSKVTKRNWVLRECLERVPTDVDAARELLIYGLKNADLEEVVNVDEKFQDKSRWSPLQYEETEAEILQRMEERRRQLLAQIDFDNLTVQQKMLISTRRRLLQYLDRLSNYEMILGGSRAAGQSFDPFFFESFRSQSALDSTAGFARQGEWQAVAVMFTFNGPSTLPHRLAICSCFPETMPPFEYRSILPECDVDGEVFLWEQQELRKPDWCECPAARMAVDVEHVLEMEAVESFYNEETNLRPFRSADIGLTTEVVSQWYRMRGADIEKQSTIVENALDFIKLGLERNVPNLEHIYHQLLTLETLVYDLQLIQLNLEKLEAMNELSLCQMIMSDCDGDSFLPKLHRWLMPYLRRLDTVQPGRINELLRGLLVARSQENLDWALQVCLNSKPDQTSVIITDPIFLISLALDCIYACQKTDQLETAMKIYDCLPERPSDSKNDFILTQLHDRLDQLQSHLEAADILENYDVAITPADIASKQKDEDQIEQLFVRLTRTAMRKGQTSNENRWKELLDDMLELQNKVFNRIRPQMCYEILVGSLLSSARKESITSAGMLLKLNPDVDTELSLESTALLESECHRPLEMAVIPFKRSKQLILQASEEYFNSSENLSDPSLELAILCLGLVTVEDEQIQEEKDLISAAQLLYDFGLDMPPLKIRLSRNRILFVDQVLKHSGKAYKNTSRLLRLGHFLRAYDECSLLSKSERRKDLEGRIYVRIAETALAVQDLDVAAQMCNSLRLANQPVGWKVCVQLAEHDEVLDLGLKSKLMSYALVHCPSENIEGLLQLQWKLERQQLRRECVKQIETYMHYENGEESTLAFVDSASVETYRHSIAKKQQNLATSTTSGRVSQQVLQTTADTTKQLVNVVKSSLKLKEVRPTENPFKSTTVANPLNDNKECNRWGLPVFYWDVWSCSTIGLHESQFGASYRLFSIPEMTSSELNLLTGSWRIFVLDSLEQPYVVGGVCLNDDVLAKLSECLFPEDCLLAFGHLMDLEKPTRAWESLTRLPSTEITLQLAAYYFALRMIRFSSNGRAVVNSSPRSLIEHCVAFGEEVELSEEQSICHSLLKRCLRLLADVSEAQQLRRLDGGVDINRFTTDDLYKRDTIVGLAITTDPAVFSSAVRLAAHYGVSAWEVTFSHLTALFAEETIAPSLITRRMEEHRMRVILLEDANKLGQRMIEVIYPSISGRDYGRLKLFFEVLSWDATMVNLMEPSATVHIQILNKLESIKERSDLKKLTRSVTDFEREIECVATTENVGKLVKLAHLISSSVKGLSSNVSQATVHSIWTRKYFFQLADENKSIATTDWLHRLESCKNHINKLDAQGFLTLADYICFSDRSLDVLSLDARVEICRRFLKMATERGKGKGTKDSTAAENCRIRIQKWFEHLERLKSNEYVEIRSDLVSKAGNQLWREFEQSRSEHSRLHRLLLQALISCHHMSIVRLLHNIYPSDFPSTPEDVLTDAIRLTLKHLQFTDQPEKQTETHLLVDQDAVQVLRHLLTEVSIVLGDSGNSLIIQSDIGKMLRQFYEDDKIDVQARLQLMLMLQTLPIDFVGSSDTGSRVQWFRTLALIQQSWSAKGDDTADVNDLIRHLSEKDLRSPERRRVLFGRLLEMSHTIAHLASLAKLLHFWPPFESVVSDANSTPWVMLWAAMTKIPSFVTDASVLESLKLALEQKPPLSDQCIRIIYQTVSDDSPSTDAGHTIRLRLHVALRSSLPFLLDDAIRFMEAAQELNERDYDEEILDLILELKLAGRIAGTPLYRPFCERLLSTSPPSARVEEVARQLVDHGRRSEAGHLLQLTSGLPRYLLNMSTSLYFARKRLL